MTEAIHVMTLNWNGKVWRTVGLVSILDFYLQYKQQIFKLQLSRIKINMTEQHM